MKSSNKKTVTVASLLVCSWIMLSSGCDRDSTWEKVDSSKNRVFLAALVFELTRPFYVSGTVTGLTGTLELQINGEETLAIQADGNFQFTTGIRRNHDYDVTVLTQPSGQTCEVTNGSGTVEDSNITNVTVTCTTD